MRKHGWNDKASEILVRRKTESGMAGRSEIQTMFAYIDADEGRGGLSPTEQTKEGRGYHWPTSSTWCGGGGGCIRYSITRHTSRAITSASRSRPRRRARAGWLTRQACRFAQPDRNRVRSGRLCCGSKEPGGLCCSGYRCRDDAPLPPPLPRPSLQSRSTQRSHRTRTCARYVSSRVPIPGFFKACFRLIRFHQISHNRERVTPQNVLQCRLRTIFGLRKIFRCTSGGRILPIPTADELAKWAGVHDGLTPLPSSAN